MRAKQRVPATAAAQARARAALQRAVEELSARRGEFGDMPRDIVADRLTRLRVRSDWFEAAGLPAAWVARLGKGLERLSVRCPLTGDKVAVSLDSAGLPAVVARPLSPDVAAGFTNVSAWRSGKIEQTVEGTALVPPSPDPAYQQVYVSMRGEGMAPARAAAVAAAVTAGSGR